MDFNLWTVITFAVVLGCMIPILGIVVSYKEKKLKLSGGAEALRSEFERARSDLERANARIENLGERVKVLERLATDQDVELGRSLEKLKQEADGARA